MTNQVVSHSRMLNSELIEQYGPQLATGKVVITHISDPIVGSDGVSYRHLYFAQQKEVGTAAASAQADELFLGWSAQQIVRAHRNAKTEIVQALNLKPGFVMENAVIHVKDDYTAEDYGDRMQEPRKYGQNSRNAGQIITHNGRPVYRHTTLFVGQAPKDVILKPDTIESTSVTPTDEQDFDDFNV